MKLLTNLTAIPTDGLLVEPHAGISSVHDEPITGWIRVLTFGAAGLIVSHGDDAVAIPLAELIALVERSQPALKPPAGAALVSATSQAQALLAANPGPGGGSAASPPAGGAAPANQWRNMPKWIQDLQAISLQALARSRAAAQSAQARPPVTPLRLNPTPAAAGSAKPAAVAPITLTSKTTS